MLTNNTLDRITNLLRNSNLTWLLPNLRQDFVVWKSLNDPVFFEKFSQLNPIGSEITPADFSPSKLALIALDQSSLLDNQSQDFLKGIDDQILQLAMRSICDQTSYNSHPQDLASAGLMALALTYNFQETNAWNGLIDIIEERPGKQWLSPLVCLFGFVHQASGLLNSLVQPGASALRIELAVHIVLSNPIPPNDQIAILMGLCHGSYGDQLPPRERLLILRSMYEQNLQFAKDFSLEWLEIHPETDEPRNNDHDLPIENINNLAETLFQVELHKIAGKPHILPRLLNNEKELTNQMSAGLVNHYLYQATRFLPEKSLNHALLAVHDQVIYLTDHALSLGKSSSHQAKLALLLSDQGLTDEVNQLMPPPEAPLPSDPDVLYTMAKIANKDGNHRRASDAVALILEILDRDPSTYSIDVWGDHLSLVNLGNLLLDLHKPESASQILNLALHTCPNDASILKLSADSYTSSHKDKEAAGVLQALISLDPQNMDHHRAYAQSLEAIGVWEEALSERSFVIESSQDQTEKIHLVDIYAYSNCALKASKPELTLTACSNILSSNPEDGQALVYMGKAFKQSGETDKGIEFLIRATQSAPHLSEAWLALAEAQKDIYPLKSVIDTLNNASQAVPGSSQIHFMLGGLYLQDNALTLALPELRSAVELAPENPQVLFSYGQALHLLGHVQESREVLSKAYQLDPSFPELPQLYSKILVDLGELEEALSPLEVLINSKHTRDPISYLDYARCILALKKRGSTTISPLKALIALNEVLQIDPELSEAKALIAESLAANGDKEMAFQAYREALDTPLIVDKTWLERLSYGFGCVASSIGKHDIAIAALQEASQVNPSNPAIFKTLSDAYLAADLPEDAIRSARNVLLINSEDPDNLAWFAQQAVNLIHNEAPDLANSPTAISNTVPSEALNALAKAIQIAPTRTDLLIQLGYFQSSIGLLEDSRETFNSIARLDFAAIDDLKSASDYLSGIGDHTAAIDCLENGISQDMRSTDQHDPSLYAKLAHEYVKNNDHTSAINTLDKAIDILPNDGSLVSQKIDILLDLGQSIEALNCIETELRKDIDGNQQIDLYFLASRINRSIGDFSGAYRYAQKGINITRKLGGVDGLSSLPDQYLTHIAEIYRALIQPDQAIKLIRGAINKSESELNLDPVFLDYICLHTELALETGDQISPEFQNLQLEVSNPYFSRLMAIKARLMNKAGNYKQAVQILQLAEKSLVNLDQASSLPSWQSAFSKYLAVNSYVEAALDLGLWDQAVSVAKEIMDSSPAEPMSLLNLAKAIILKAEFYNLCERTDVANHIPSVDSISNETYKQFTQYLEHAKSVLDPFKADGSIDEYALNDDQIFRWQARADIAFKRNEEINYAPGEILIHQLTSSDAAALIYHLHQLDLRDSDSDSISRIIKLARSYPRNPTVLLQVALAIHEENPTDAMRSLLSVTEQNPYSKGPILAFCNVLLAKIALNLDEFDKAEKAIENALDFWPDESNWHTLAAQIYKRMDDSNSAIDHLSEATNLAPKNVSYHMELGKVYFENANDESNMLKHAQKSFENALELEPEEVQALFLLATVQFRLNDLENAEINARKSQMLAPNRADIYQLLSAIAIGMNDFQGAYEYANKAVQLSPKDLQSTLILARSLSALGMHDEALAKINALLPVASETITLQLERVHILSKINGSQAGLNELITLVNSYPDDFNLLNALAKSYIEIGEPEHAAEVAQRALEACTERTSRCEQANLHLLIGQILRHTGELEKSIQHLSDAIQLVPDRLEPYLELGLARKERCEFQQALRIFEQATSIAPDDPRAPYQAGIALKESKDYKSSETMLRRAVSLAPNDLNIRRQLAAVVALNLVHNPRPGRN